MEWSVCLRALSDCVHSLFLFLFFFTHVLIFFFCKYSVDSVVGGVVFFSPYARLKVAAWCPSK